MYRRAHLLMAGNAVLIGGLAIVVSIITDRPLIDPEGSFLGPSWLRLPLLLFGALLLDLLPRTLWLSKFRVREMWPIARDRLRTHWNKDRVVLVASGIISFYIVYVSYRNLKSFLPALTDVQFDHELHLIDRALFFGHEPGTVLQQVFGTNVTAWVLSYIYLWFLPLVPLAVTCWLVWSRNLNYGYWFVTSQCLAWTLGTATYYMLPTVGPGIQYPFVYADLAHTPTSDLMDALVSGRQNVLLADVADAVQSVAGFASLHTGITLLVALMVQHTVNITWVRWAFWINFGLTIIATLYFGWHYAADDVAGVALALVSFYVGGLMSGQRFERKGSARRAAAREAAASAQTPA
ncbi:MAG TPA: phosphatase PAP2 family protein [Nocardioides sp.]|uniref:phosphatase PAP2 family protein n=1 Tax=Nocardioides sp. TaxID=35761 RepID=UPI002ED9633B